MNFDNIGSGNDLMPDSTKPLPAPMLTDYLWGSQQPFCNIQLRSIWQQALSTWVINPQDGFECCNSKITATSPGGQWTNLFLPELSAAHFLRLPSFWQEDKNLPTDCTRLSQENMVLSAVRADNLGPNYKDDVLPV